MVSTDFRWTPLIRQSNNHPNLRSTLGSLCLALCPEGTLRGLVSRILASRRGHLFLLAPRGLLLCFSSTWASFAWNIGPESSQVPISLFIGLKKNDKILKINGKPPKNVNDAVSFIKKVGPSEKTPFGDMSYLGREEDSVQIGESRRWGRCTRASEQVLKWNGLYFECFQKRWSFTWHHFHLFSLRNSVQWTVNTSIGTQSQFQ